MKAIAARFGFHALFVRVQRVRARTDAYRCRVGLLEHIAIVGAPLAGGPSTPALTAAVCEAGGLGFVAAGYKTVREVADDLAAVRAATSQPFGVNLFVPSCVAVDEQALARYTHRLRIEADRYGVDLGEPRRSDDDWQGKLELVACERPAVVSFTFGCPAHEVIATLQDGGSDVWCTVTSPAEASRATAAGVDALVVQGAEAGGHQSSFDDTDSAAIPLLPLLALVRRATAKPLVAAGGIATAETIRAVRAAGASAAQIGSALMLTPEAGTTDAHRAAFGGDAPTALTRAFTGKRARGIVNRFMRDHDAVAPKAYPHVHYLTAPIRAAARAQGDSDGINLWAGQAYQLAQPVPAIDLVRDWLEQVDAV